MLRHITRLIAGLIATGLLVASAPSASAAMTYDITQVGDADWVGITDSNGNDATKTPLASNGVNVRVTFDVHIDDMSRLAEGDTVTVSFGAASGSHYGPWGLFDSANLPRVLRNRDGVDMFTLTAPNAYTLTMTRTGDAAVGSFDGSVTVATQLWMSNGSATSSTWTVGDGHSITFACHKFENSVCGGNTALTPKAKVDNGFVLLSADAVNCGTMRRIAQGQGTDGASPDSLVGWYRITAESGAISKLALRGYNVRVMFAVDENTPGWWDGNSAGYDLTRISGVDVSTFDKAKADLPAGRIAIERQSDGSWVYAFNLGSRLPGLKNSLQVSRAGDEATLKLIDKTGRIWQYAQQISYLHFADESIPNRVKVEMQSTESAYRTTTLTTKPLDPAVGTGQSAIRYDPNGGDGDAFRKAGDPGTQATTPEAATFLRKGYAFAGWNTKADGTGTAYQAGADVAYPAEGDTLTLYARWEANAYKTEFRDWRGRTITSGTARYGTTPTVPALSDTTWLADPDMNFDNVDGWHKTDRYGGSFEFTKDGLITRTRDLYGPSKKPFDGMVHIELQGDASKANGQIGVGWHEIGNGKAYMEWNRCEKGQADCVYDGYSTPSKDNNIETWLQIDSNDDKGYGELLAKHMQLTQVDPATHNGVARDGYVFTGWDKDPSKPVEGDTVYTARYRPAVYKIRFDANGGIGTMAEQSHTYDRKQALTANTFAREGYRFTGWNTRGDGKGKAFTDKRTVTNLLAHDGATGVLYAQWKRIPETALPWSGGTMTHNLTTILGGGLLILAIPFVLMRRRRLG